VYKYQTKRIFNIREYIGKYTYIGFGLALFNYILMAVIHVYIFKKGDIYSQLFLQIDDPVSYIRPYIFSIITLSGILINRVIQTKENLVYQYQNSINDFTMLVENIDDLIFILDKNLCFVKYYQKKNANLILEPDFFIGKSIENVGFSEELIKIVKPLLLDSLSTGKTNQTDYFIDVESGREWYNLNISFNKIKKELICLARDVTDEKNIREIEKNQEWKYRRILDNFNDMYFRTDLDGTIIMITPSVPKILKKDNNEFIGENISDILGIEINELINNNKEISININNEKRYFNTSFKFYTNDKGINVGSEGIVSDISQVKSSYLKIEKEKENFINFFNSITDLFFIGNEKGEILEVNNAVLEKLKYTKEELIQLNILDVHPNEYREEAQNIFGDMFKGIRESCPLPLISKDGNYIPVETRVWFGKWNDKECIFGISKDLSKEREALDRFEKLFEDNPALMAISSIKDNRFIDVNRSFCELLAYSKEEILGKTSEDLELFIDEKEQKELAIELETTGKIDKKELKVKSKDGRILTGLFSGEIINNQGKKEFLTVMIDITERKELEKNLKKNDRLIKELSKQVPGVIYQYKIYPDGRACFPFSSEHIKEIYEVKPNEVLENADTVMKRLHPDDYDGVVNTIMYSKEHLTKWEDEYRVILPERGERWVKGIANPEKLEDGSVLWHGYIFDITENKKEQIRTQEIKDQFELAIAGTNDGIWDWNILTNELFLSRRWKEILGYEDSEIKNEFNSFISLIYEEDIKKVNNYVQSYFNGEIEKYEIEFRMKHKNGSIVWILAKGEALKDKEGKPYRMAGSHSDITERKELEKNLIKSREEAIQASRAKSEFLSNMSHEIRTPLNGIIGFSDILNELDLDEEFKEVSEMIKVSGENLLNLVNDILDISKIEAGKMKVDIEKFELEKVVDNLLKIYETRANNKHLKIIKEYENDIPNFIYGDSLKLTQILNNLISNSLKFTSKGYIKLAVRILEQKENSVLLRFIIEDTGAGINKEKQEKLFEKFEQGEHYLTKKYGGTGLGLSIVKGLIDLLNAKIDVHTELGKGTKFTLDIPFEIREKEQKIIKSTENILIEKKLKIIMAEDVKINQNLVKKILEKNNIKDLIIVEDGQKLIEELEKDSYDIILMDIQMPILNGIEATQIIKKSEKWKNIPVIGLSAFALKENIEKALDVGMDDYISKPVKKEELLEKIYRWSYSNRSLINK